jgi:hypothetical protein
MSKIDAKNQARGDIEFSSVAADAAKLMNGIETKNSSLNLHSTLFFQALEIQGSF